MSWEQFGEGAKPDSVWFITDFQWHVMEYQMTSNRRGDRAFKGLDLLAFQNWQTVK
jgi:hypothetical protein